MNFIGSIVGKILDWILEKFIYYIAWIVNYFLGWLLYFVELLASQLIGFMMGFFEMLAGLENVKYNGKSMNIMEVFTGTYTQGGRFTSNLYWEMTKIGMVLTFGFAIFAVVRKMFDERERIGQSMGTILGNLFKGIMVMVIMGFSMSMILTSTSVLMQQVKAAFSTAYEESQKPMVITFTEEEYADMALIMDTIGNYSLNPSYNSRYNINACFNEIRPRLRKLFDKEKFNLPFAEYDEFGHLTQRNWQVELQLLAGSEDLSQDIPIDYYNQDISAYLLEIMELLRTDPTFRPMEKFTYTMGSYELEPGSYKIEDMIMVIGSLGAAKDNKYNGADSGITDSLRAPYLFRRGKQIYNPKHVQKDFSLNVGDWNHITVIFLIFALGRALIAMILNVGARILNILVLYVTMPLFASVTPLDDGEKLKQWTQAFIVQCVGFMGYVIAVQMFVFMMPIVLDSRLVFFPSVTMNWFAKSVLLGTMAFSISGASNMIIGILSGNGAMASANALSGLGERAQNMIDGAIWKKMTDKKDNKNNQQGGDGAGDGKGGAAGDASAMAAGGGKADALPVKSNVGGGKTGAVLSAAATAATAAGQVAAKSASAAGNAAAKTASTAGNAAKDAAAVGKAIPKSNAGSALKPQSSPSALSSKPGSNASSSIPAKSSAAAAPNSAAQPKSSGAAATQSSAANKSAESVPPKQTNQQQSNDAAGGSNEQEEQVQQNQPFDNMPQQPADKDKPDFDSILDGSGDDGSDGEAVHNGPIHYGYQQPANFGAPDYSNAIEMQDFSAGGDMPGKAYTGAEAPYVDPAAGLGESDASAANAIEMQDFSAASKADVKIIPNNIPSASGGNAAGGNAANAAGKK